MVSVQLYGSNHAAIEECVLHRAGFTESQGVARVSSDLLVNLCVHYLLILMTGVYVSLTDLFNSFLWNMVYKSEKLLSD